MKFADANKAHSMSGFELAIRESRFVDRLCLFADHFKQFFSEIR